MLGSSWGFGAWSLTHGGKCMMWNQWLHTASCRDVLFHAAAVVAQLARRYGVPNRLVFPSGTDGSAGSGASAESLTELADDLWLFVNDHAVRWEKARPLDLLLAQGTDRVAHHIAAAYTQCLLDRARTQGGDAQKAFYRRLRQVIAKDPHFRYHAEKRRSFYACAEAAPTDPPGRTDAPPADYAQWPSPPSLPDGFGSLDARTLADLAFFFCREYTKGVGRPVWVPIRELTRYLSTLLGIPQSPRWVPLEAPSSGDDGEPVEICLPDAPTQETALTRKRLPELARSLTALWTARERKAFALRYGDHEKLERIAQAVGCGGPSGARNVLERLQRGLRDFCLRWPGLSPPDLDESLFGEFCEAVVAVCKEGDEGRRAE